MNNQVENSERLLESLQFCAFKIKPDALTLSDIHAVNLKIVDELCNLLEMIYFVHTDELDMYVPEDIGDNLVHKNLVNAMDKANQIAEIARFLNSGDTAFSIKRRLDASTQ